VSQESGQLKNASGSSEGNSSESAELLQLLHLQDDRRRTCYNLLAPSVKERNLWYKCLEEARSEFLKNEKCHLQRQQSSKYAAVVVHHFLLCLLLIMYLCSNNICFVHRDIFIYAKKIKQEPTV
jgi:hypothetical protein